MLKSLFQHMFLGSKGGFTRVKILVHLKEKERNANELTTAIGMDYSTIDHHLNVLLKNNLIVRRTEGYGATFAISALTAENWEFIQDIWDKLNKSEAKEE